MWAYIIKWERISPSHTPISHLSRPSYFTSSKSASWILLSVCELSPCWPPLNPRLSWNLWPHRKSWPCSSCTAARQHVPAETAVPCYRVGRWPAVVSSVIFFVSCCCRLRCRILLTIIQPKNVIRNGSMLFLMAAIRKIHWQDVATQDISNFVAQKLSQLW